MYRYSLDDIQHIFYPIIVRIFIQSKSYMNIIPSLKLYIQYSVYINIIGWM